MSDKFFLLKSFRDFFNFRKGRLILLFIITLIQGLSQGTSILLLIPMLQALQNKNSGEQSEYTAMFGKILKLIGLEPSLLIYSLAFAFILLVVAATSYLQTVWQGDYQMQFTHNMRKRLFHKLLQAQWKDINTTSKHAQVQLFTTEISKSSVFYYFYLSLASRILFIIAHLVITATISPGFTLCVVLAGGLSFLALSTFLRRSAALGFQDLGLVRDMLKRIDDFWLTVKLAKVHGSESFYKSKFDEASGLAISNQYKQAQNKAQSTFVFSLLSIVGILALVTVAYQFNIPFDTLILLILLFARIFPRFSLLYSDLNAMMGNIASVKFILAEEARLSKAAREHRQRKGQVLPPMQQGIGITNLSFRHPGQDKLLENLTASIPARALTGIMGSSGAGKTTLIDILCGLHQPLSGSISVDGTSVDLTNVKDWQSGLAYLPQDTVFIDGTIRENLVWDNPDEISDATIDNLLEKVNMLDVVRAQPKGLDSSYANYQFYFSGGERQRLALVRILLRNPHLLILDEATSALDTENEDQIMEILNNIKETTTIVFITHRERLRKYFDHLIEL